MDANTCEQKLEINAEQKGKKDVQGYLNITPVVKRICEKVCMIGTQRILLCIVLKETIVVCSRIERVTIDMAVFREEFIINSDFFRDVPSWKMIIR